MRSEPTLVLTRRDVAELLDLETCIGAVESAFRLEGAGAAPRSGVLGYPTRGGGFHIKAAALDLSRPYFAAKVNGNFPGNPSRWNLPTIRGVVVLSDAENGAPLAVMDSIEITSLRTGAATAVAAKRLARSDSKTATVCGCGTQGRVQLRALALVLPIERAFAWDAALERAEAFAGEMSAVLGIEVAAVAEPGPAISQSDVCVTSTPSRRAFVRLEDVSAGTFVAAVGADAPDKQELEPALLGAGKLVVDSLDQCATIGELHHALEAGAVARSSVHAELSQVVSDEKSGRESAEEITVFDSTGVALEDVAAAAAVYERAVASGRGTPIDLAS